VFNLETHMEDLLQMFHIALTVDRV